jgi:hypothetical protein
MTTLTPKQKVQLLSLGFSKGKCLYCEHKCFFDPKLDYMGEWCESCGGAGLIYNDLHLNRCGDCNTITGALCPECSKSLCYGCYKTHNEKNH